MLTFVNNLLSILDLKTLIFISLLFTLAYIVVMLHILMTRKVYEGFHFIIIGHVFVFMGITITLLLRGKVSDFISIFIGNVFLLLYPLFYYIGLIRFYGISNSLGHIGFLFFLILIGCMISYNQENLNNRVIIHSILSACLFSLASIRPILSERPRSYKIQRFMSISLLPIALYYVYRVFYTYFKMPYDSFDSFIQNDDMMKILFILSILTAFVMFYCYLAMTGDRLAMELKEARQRELDAMQNQQKLFSVITHDLKTPITAINRSAQMIAHKLSKQDFEGVEQRLNTIKANTISLLSLIEQYQDNAILMTKGIKLDLSKVNIVELVGETVSNYSLMTDRKINLIFNKNIPHFEADKQLLQIVLNNVIDNAIKYSSPDTDITISIKQENGNIIIEIIDKGIGIPESEIKNITSRYYRASNVQQYKGSGVGLHTSALIMALHKGTLDIKSELNKVTRVIITMPIKMS